MRFRPVYFYTDPFLGSRLVLALLLSATDGSWTSSVLGPDVVVDEQHRPVVDRLRARLEGLPRVERFDALPPAFGPTVELGEARDVPSDVENVVEWARGMLGWKLVEFFGSAFSDSYLERLGLLASPEEAAECVAAEEWDSLGVGAVICVGWDPVPNEDYDPDLPSDEDNPAFRLNKTAEFCVTVAADGDTPAVLAREQ